MKKILFLTLMVSSILVNATITVTPVNTTINSFPTSNYLFDLDNDGTFDYNIDAYQIGGTNEVQLRVAHINAEVSTAFAATINVVNTKYLGVNFINWWQSHDSYIFQYPEMLELDNVGYKYIGLRLLKNGDYYYGWLQLKVSVLSVAYVEIVNYAFEDTPNTMITAGQTVSITTAINEVKESLEFSIYPNPTSENVSISLGGIKADVKVTLMNSTGQAVLNKDYNNVDLIRLKLDYPKGVYFLTAKTDDGLRSKKIIIQ